MPYTDTSRIAPKLYTRTLSGAFATFPKKQNFHTFTLTSPRNPNGIARWGGTRFDLLVAQRKIGRRCDFLEDVSEDVHFDWKFLGDVNFFQEIKFN